MDPDTLSPLWVALLLAAIVALLVCAALLEWFVRVVRAWWRRRE